MEFLALVLSPNLLYTDCELRGLKNSSNILALEHTGPPPHVDFQVENLSLEHRFLPEFSEYSPLHNKKRNIAHVRL